MGCADIIARGFPKWNYPFCPVGIGQENSQAAGGTAGTESTCALAVPPQYISPIGRNQRAPSMQSNAEFAEDPAFDYPVAGKERIITGALRGDHVIHTGGKSDSHLLGPVLLRQGSPGTGPKPRSTLTQKGERSEDRSPSTACLRSRHYGPGRASSVTCTFTCAPPRSTVSVTACPTTP